MAVKLYDLAKMTTATTGTGTITLDAAASGFLSFAAAGVQSGETVRYGIRDGVHSEIGYGVYTASGTTLTRTVTSSTNSNTAINLSGSALVFICASAIDFTVAPISNLPTPISGNVAVFALANVVPQMTSNTSGGAVVTASSTYSATPAWQAFNNLRTAPSGWITNGSQTGWLAIQLPSAKIVYGYGVIGWSPDTWSGRCPKSWTFQGSNDGTNWMTLDTRTNLNQDTWWRWGERFFPIASPASYLYYRINVTANYGDGYMGVSQLILYGEADPPANGYAGFFMRTPAGDILRLSPNGIMI